MLVILLVVTLVGWIVRALHSPLGVTLVFNILSIIALLWGVVRLFRAGLRLLDEEVKRNPRPW